MPRDLRTERHYALAEFCCTGDCRQGRDCPLTVQPDEWEPMPDSEALWMLLLILVLS
jgi:hypothetical protein